MSHTIACPLCHKLNVILPPDIGRFAVCEHCREPYYVVVPPLDTDKDAESAGNQRLISRIVPTARANGVDQPGVARERFEDAITKFERMVQFNMYLQFIILMMVAYLSLRSLF